MQTTSGTPLTSTPARPTGRHLTIGLLCGVLVVGYALDQLTKAWASANLDPNRPQELVGSLLQLHLTHNPGAAFSIGTNATWVLTTIACAVVIATIFMARKLRSRVWALAIGLLLAGALGNLTDRFFRAPGGGRGEVVDFLQLPHWPIFNVADCCVVTAGVLIALLALRGVGIDGTRVTGAKDAAPKRRDGEDQR